MSFLWIIALVQAAWVAHIWSTGKIRLRGWEVVDRDVEPRIFRRYFIVFAISVPVIIAGAIFPSFSN